MSTLIQCRLGPYETNVGGQTYSFQNDRESRAVCIVENLMHRSLFLSVVHYIEVEPLPILAVQVPAPAPIAALTPSSPHTLLGSSILPNHVEIPHGTPVALGDIVARAYGLSGLDIDGWNALPNADREGKLADVVQWLTANAEREKAAADAITAEEAAAAAEVARQADAAAQVIKDAADAAAAEAAAAEEAAAIERARLAKIPVIDPIIEIGGLGPVAQTKLAEIDITSFAQIAAWDAPTILMMEEHLGMKGAISRGDWVGQAKQLQADKEAAAAVAAANQAN